MRRPHSRRFVAVTALVSLTTLCALALPEGNGGRDSVVRLTRGGLQRLGCADTAFHDHVDPDAVVEAASERQPDDADGTPTAAVASGVTVLRVPHRYVILAARPVGLWPVAPPGHPVSGRAPPAL